jgi:3,4-dihydroxyphenylacetate 2,3-dioxygenase
MAGGLIAAAIAPHTPFLLDEANTPPRLHGVLAGCRDLGRLIRGLAPDLLVINSSHWNTPFLWYVTSHNRHRGRCISDKDDHQIGTRDYDYPGDPEFAHALAGAIAADGLPSGEADDPMLSWDYGVYVPAKFVSPDATMRVVVLSTCLMATLSECRRVGGLIDSVARQTGRRTIFIASTAFAHKLVLEPENAPPPEHLEADLAFIGLLRDGRLADAWTRLPSYAATVHAELAGRSLATFLGGFDPAVRVTPHALGEYGHSSGSGNFTLALVRQPEPAH